MTSFKIMSWPFWSILWSFFYKSIVPKIRQNVSKKVKQQLQRNMPQQKIKQDKNSYTKKKIPKT